MKTSHRSLRLGALTAGLLVTLPTFATTYLCDNDRSASQYPHCNVSYYGVNGGTWIYYSGQSHDYNGDDRRERGSSQGSGFYDWTFDTTRTYTFSAYLDNAAFNEPNALYVSSDGNSLLYVHLNQNTASGGWHTIGSISSTTIGVAAGSSSKYIAGADGMEASFSSASTAAGRFSNNSLSAGVAGDVVDTTDKCGPIASQVDPRIVATQQRMLDAPQHYQDIAGRFQVFFRNNGQNETVDFQISEAQRRSSVRVTDEHGEATESAFDGSRLVMRYPGTASYRSFQLFEQTDVQARTQSSLVSNVSVLGPRFYRNARCESVFVHHEDPAHSASATELTDPQNYASWLYDSHSHIAGHESLLGRPVTVIEGQQDDYLHRKLGAATFKMWVDDATGVLLKLVGKDDDGKLAYSVEASSIDIDKGMYLPATVAAIPAGWKSIEMAPMPTASDMSARP